jgi:hypothetical protein
MSDFSVVTIEAVQDIPKRFDALIRFLCAIKNLGVQSNVMFAAVAEKNFDADVVFRGYGGCAARQKSNSEFMAIFSSQGSSPIFSNASFRVDTTKGGKVSCSRSQQAVIFDCSQCRV